MKKKRKPYFRITKAKDLERKWDTWREVEENNELTHCKKCGKKIWMYWKKKKYWKDYEEMDLCAPCYFRKMSKLTPELERKIDMLVSTTKLLSAVGKKSEAMKEIKQFLIDELDNRKKTK